MKLKLKPGLKQVARPATFESWVEFALLGMQFWLEKRTYDDFARAQINKICLTDTTMIVNETLMTQSTASSDVIYTPEQK